MDINDILDRAETYIETVLRPIIRLIGEEIEGNIFDEGPNLTIFLPKRKNIIMACKGRQKGLEIGFNAGYSAVLILLSNPDIILTCVDIGLHKYVIPCYERIKKDFGNRIHLIIGDSRLVVPQIYDKFDLIHIDGGHYIDVAESDIVHTHDKLLKKSVIIMDDVNVYDRYSQLANLWMYFVNKFGYIEPTFEVYKNNHQDVRESNFK